MPIKAISLVSLMLVSLDLSLPKEKFPEGGTYHKCCFCTFILDEIRGWGLFRWLEQIRKLAITSKMQHKVGNP